MALSRHEARVFVFMLVFSNSFHDKDDIADVMNNFFSQDGYEEILMHPEVTDELKAKASAICEHADEFDALIDEKIEGWKANRMGRADLTAIRLALYEAKYENMPKGACVSEAVSLAEEYGTDKSAAFVNGVLARLL